MSLLNIKTGEPFGYNPRFHHRDENTLVGAASAVSPRARSLITARNLTMSGKRGGIPSGWVEVEYLQSVDRSYIDTGLAPMGRNVSLYAKFALGQYVWGGGSSYPFGSDGFGDTRFSFGAVGSNKLIREFRIGAYYQSPQLTLSVGDIHTFMIDSRTGRMEWDGKLFGTSPYNTSNTTFSDKSILLYTSRAAGGAVRTIGDTSVGYRGMRLYEATITEDDQLIRLYLPVKNTSTGEGALAEILGGEICHNQGFGAFECGPDKMS